MMNQQEFTAAVLAAEPTLYRVAKAMVGNEGLGAAGHPAPAPVFPHVAHPDPHQRVQGNSPPTGAAGPL